MQGIPYYQRAKFGLSWASIETMITDLPLKQQLFAETGVYRFLFLVFSFLIKNSQVERYSFLLFKSGGEKNHVKTKHATCFLPSWHVGQSASSGRPTKVIGFQLFLTPNDKSLCFGSFVSWQRQWYDEGWDPQHQVDGHQ